MDLNRIFLTVFSLFYSSLLSAASIDLELNELGLPYYYDGEEVKVTARGEGTFELKDSRGKVMQEIACGAELLLPTGYYEIVGGIDNATRAPFVVGHPKRAHQSIVGIDAHLSETLGGGSDMSQQLWVAEFAGAHALRDRFRWRKFEPEEGNWDSSAFDAYFQPQIDAGFELMVAVEGNANWSAEQYSEPHNLGHPKPEAFKELFERLAKLSQDQPVKWQVWNEPNPIGIAGSRYPGGITPEKFIRHFLQPAAAGAGETSALVLGGSAGMDLPWQEGLIQAGAMDYVQGFDVHPYAVTPRQFEIQMREVLRDLDEVGFEGSIYGTEFHADYSDVMVQMYVSWFAMDERMRNGSLMYFDLQDWEFGSNIQDAQKMGLATSKLIPKPKMAAFNEVAHRLSGAKYLEAVAATDEIGIHKIEDADGEIYYTAFAHSGFECLTFLSGNHAIQVSHPEGGIPEVIEPVNGMFVLPLEKNAFRYIDGATDLRVASDFVKVGIFQADSGKGRALGSVEIEIHNPTDTTLRISVGDTGNEELSAVANHSKFTVSALGTAQIQLGISAKRWPVRIGEHTLSLKVLSDQGDAICTVPVAFQIDPGVSLQYKLMRGKTDQLDTLVVNASGDEVLKDVSVLEEDGSALLELGQRSGDPAFRISLEGEDKKEIETILEFASGKIFATAASISLMNSIDSGLDADLNIDYPVKWSMAQPFLAQGSSMSALELAFNNWSNEVREIAISVREGEPGGPIVGRAASESEPRGKRWIRFSFPETIRLKPGTTYWIVNETTYPDEHLRWKGRNPHPDRVDQIKRTFEGVAWSRIGRDDIGAMGFSYRILR